MFPGPRTNQALFGKRWMPWGSPPCRASDGVGGVPTKRLLIRSPVRPVLLRHDERVASWLPSASRALLANRKFQSESRGSHFY